MRGDFCRRKSESHRTGSIKSRSRVVTVVKIAVHTVNEGRPPKTRLVVNSISRKTRRRWRFSSKRNNEKVPFYSFHKSSLPCDKTSSSVDSASYTHTPFVCPFAPFNPTSYLIEFHDSEANSRIQKSEYAADGEDDALLDVDDDYDSTRFVRRQSFGDSVLDRYEVFSIVEMDNE
jgi:hypothetical protein